MRIKKDRERIKKLVSEVINNEYNESRISPKSRVKEIIKRIQFRIDNPRYVRLKDRKSYNV